MNQLLDELRRPFHPSQIIWKPGAVKGERALALAYADLRAYMNRLDEVCGADWSVAYEPWGDERVICKLTICGVTRSSTGETTNEAERSEIGGTVAEAQAFKRAAAMFGLGRYLYNLPTGWADYDPATKKFTDKAKTKLMGILVQHYRHATDSKVEMAEIFTGDEDAAERTTAPVAVDEQMEARVERFESLGSELYGDQWPKVRQRNVSRMSGGKTQKVSDLSPEQIQKIIDGMVTLKANRTPLSSAK